MQDFAAIDFETANNERSSVCSVGIVIVRGGKIVDKFYSLIKPEPDYYNYWCSKVHGLCASDTDNAPIFPEVWNQIEPRIAGLPLIAHNKAFDESCLKAVFRVYQMEYPDYEFYCTCMASRRVWPKTSQPRCYCCTLRIRFYQAPSCFGGCRGMRSNCIANTITLLSGRKNQVYYLMNH